MTARLLPPAAALLLFAFPVLAQEADSTEVAPVIDAYAESVPDWQPWPQVKLHSAYEERLPANPWEPVSLADGLGDVFEPWLGSDGELEVRESAWSIRGDADTRARVQSWLDGARRFVRGRTVISVALLDVPADRPLDLAAVQEGVRAGRLEVDESVKLICDRGRVVRADVTRTRNFIARLEVEVAMGAAVADPVPMQLVIGRRLSVVARPVSATRAHVEFHLHLAEAENEMRRVELNSGTVELPLVKFLSLSAPLVLDVGEPILLGVPHPRHFGALAAVVTLESVDAPQPGDPLLVDVAALAGYGAPAPDAARLGLVEETAEDDEEEPIPADEHAAGRRQDLLDALERLDADVVPLSPAIVAIRSPSADVRRLLATTAAEPRWITRERRALPWQDLLRREDFDPLRMGLTREGADPASLGERAKRGALRLSVHARGATRLVVGTYRRYVSDFDVEIAQDVGITQAVVDSHLDGESLTLTAGGRGVAPSIRWRRVDVLATGSMPLTIIRDTGAGADAVKSDRVDVLETRTTDGRIDAEEERTITIRRQDSDAWIDVWDVR